MHSKIRLQHHASFNTMTKFIITLFMLHCMPIFSDVPYWYPTDEELDRGLAAKPAFSWFTDHKPFLQKQIRWLALGASNTVDGGSYVDHLRDRLLTLQPQAIVINGGISGYGATPIKYEFEALPVEQWPNIISFEYAITSKNTGDIGDVDKLMHFFEYKYQIMSVPFRPSFMLVELFMAGPYYPEGQPFLAKHDGYNCSDEELPLSLQPNPNVTTRAFSGSGDVLSPHYNRGSPLGPYLHTLANYYHYPLFSTVDAFWPSFVRYMLTHFSCSRWPFTRDGIHTHSDGMQLLVNRVMIPFLEEYVFAKELPDSFKKYATVNNSKKVVEATASEAMKALAKSPYISSSSSHNNKESATTGLSRSLEEPLAHRLFPLTNPRLMMVVKEAHAWGNSPSQTKLNTWLLPADRQIGQWNYTSLQRHEHDDKHQCFGSTSAKGASVFFTVHKDIERLYNFNRNESMLIYSLHVGYLHSWNTSYIGNVECNLYKVANESYLFNLHDGNIQEGVEGVVAVERKILIEGHKHGHEALKTSGPRDTIITKRLYTGPHILQCKKLDDRLACCTHMQIFDFSA